jgi:putative DNA primase/helicase
MAEVSDLQQQIGRDGYSKTPYSIKHEISEDRSLRRVLKALYANEDGDAWLFEILLRDRLRCDKASGLWYVWDGNYWKVDRLEEATAAVEEVIRFYQTEERRLALDYRAAFAKGEVEKVADYPRIQKDLKSRINRLRSAHRKRNVLRLAAVGKDSLAISGDEWDQHPWLLGCKSGVINLRTGTLRQGRHEDFIRTVAPTEWQGIDKPAPMWEKFLREIFDANSELVAYLQRFLGYAITGLSTEHIFCIFYGEGRNGKGTLLETLSHVLGPLAGPIQAEMLLAQTRSRSSANPSPDIMALRGRRIAWASETDEGRRLTAGKVKWLTGGDTLVGRTPYARHEVQFSPTHTLFLLTNNKPKADPYDYALWKRVQLVPFTLSFINNPRKPHERKRDPDLPAKLKEESPGILAWLVRGCLEWQKEGLNPPGIVKEATAQYQSEEDKIGRFISNCCIEKPQVMVKSSVLYDAYVSWCEEMGIQSLSGKVFGQKIRERFEAKRTQEGIHYRCICLQDEGEINE